MVNAIFMSNAYQTSFSSQIILDGFELLVETEFFPCFSHTKTPLKVVLIFAISGVYPKGSISIRFSVHSYSFSHVASTASNRLRDDISFSHVASTASDRLRDDISFSHAASTASDRLRDVISFSHATSTASDRLRDVISFSHVASTASNRLRDVISFSHVAPTASNRLRDDTSFSHEIGINDK